MMHESKLYSKSFTFTRRFEAFRFFVGPVPPICWKPSWVDIDLLQVCALHMLPLQCLSLDWKPWYTILVPSYHIISRLAVSCRPALTTYISFLRNSALAISGHASQHCCPYCVRLQSHPVIASFFVLFFLFVSKRFRLPLFVR
jgi:hypothetical protein